jgi:hypothetical protein
MNNIMKPHPLGCGQFTIIPICIIIAILFYFIFLKFYPYGYSGNNKKL